MKPAGNAGTAFNPTTPVTASPLSGAAHQGPVPVGVSLPVPLTMTKFQAGRLPGPGTTVSLAPRVNPTTLVTATGGGNYTGLPLSGPTSSHIPKGASPRLFFFRNFLFHL